MVAGILVVAVSAGVVGASSPPSPAGKLPSGFAARPRPVSRVAPALGVGAPGDVIEHALPIDDLPFLAEGNTCAFADDYDEACPFGESTSPDVVYAFSPAWTGAIDVRLCDSAYDTKVYVYDGAWTPGAPLACDDDGCGADGFRSELREVPVQAGRTYYVVVDGYFGACGDFTLEVAVSVPCGARCRPGDAVEPEVVCDHGYVDETNGGCVSPSPVFTDVPCAASGTSSWCGTYGGYIGEGTTEWRDTDWYEIDAAANTGDVSWCVTGEYRTQMGLVDPAAGCTAPVFAVSQVIEACETGCLPLPPGDWWLFVSVAGFGPAAGECGGRYRMTLQGYECPDAVRPESWAAVKARHR